MTTSTISLVARIDVRPDSSPADVAKVINEAWPHSLAVWVTGLGARADVRDYYDQVVDVLGEVVDVGEDATAGDRQAQRTGERWTQVRFDPSIPDAYRHSRNAQPLHTDGSYIPGYPATLMACVSAAHEGGETTFLDGRALVEVLRSAAPELLDRLLATKVAHSRSGDSRVQPIVRLTDDGMPLLNWNYYCVADDAPEQAKMLAKEFAEFLRGDAISAKTVSVALQPGDAVVWKDDRVLHGRNSFVPKEVSERFLWKCAVRVRA